MLFWKIAYRNVVKNWRHSLSALLSLSASFVSLVLFDGYISDLRGMYEDSFRHRSMLGDFIVEKPKLHVKEGLADPVKHSLNEDDQKKIIGFFNSKTDVISDFVRFLNFQGMVTNGSQSAIIMGRGFDVESGERVRGKNWSWNTTVGLPLHKINFAPNTVLYPTVLGQGLARKLGCSWPVSKYVNLFTGGYEPVERPFDCRSKDLQVSVMTYDGQLNALDVNVVGLIDAGYRDIDDRYFIVPLETAQLLINSKIVSMISVQLKDTADRQKFISDFNNQFSNLLPDVKIMNWKDHLVGETYIKTMDLLAVFRNFVVIVILIISTLSVANTLIKIVKERSREIGTMRSIGFKSAQVLRLFFYETFLLSALGITIGIVSALCFTFLLNISHIRYKAGMLSEPVLFKIQTDLFCYGRAIAVLVVVSLLACYISTRQEVRKRIVDNLGHV